MLVEKAGRGVGVPLAIAQDLGRAAGWLAGQGRPIDVVFEAVTKRAAGSFLNGQPPAPLAEAATIYLDAADSGLHLDHCLSPELIAALQAAREGAQTGQGRITLTLSQTKTLSALAQNTYVPATQASREGGAGAGLDDND